ncbi:MAG TPA: hypothetical protein VFW00_07315 [Rhodocyclaceae bacterium]|nr:hypothetical protein [Rhodocyclaceae bacterium]
MTNNVEPPKAPPSAPSALHAPPAASVSISAQFAEIHPAHAQSISRHQLIYSITGLVLGLVCIVGGLMMFFNGVAGKTSWAAKLFGAESMVSDAAPGAVLFIVGMFVVLITRYAFRIKN